jgi:hypothetical protein
MKKYLNILFLATLTLIVGCQKGPMVQTSEGKTISQANRFVTEICYDNLQYVNFGSGESNWGGVKFDQNNKVIMCNTNNKPSYVSEVCYKGVVYIKFGSGESNWGSAKFGKDSKILLCGEGIQANKNDAVTKD